MLLEMSCLDYLVDPDSKPIRKILLLRRYNAGCPLSMNDHAQAHRVGHSWLSAHHVHCRSR
ncbi:hypothetical protein Rmet_6758 (plasmid) [Cupriavidus metallidurans CH34]|uniref:Uncharacterized protein n=1 Tax=Cupriavidus metallidurans (strain ATCC 43123 / DSM 2839 / NBRC 102507 / CH34) TaxID=266264 RepID=D3DYG7_CUPMC|nr:hypothetical protein Rmet_6758 [Cupriavidus metallidurans CH34]